MYCLGLLRMLRLRPGPDLELRFHLSYPEKSSCFFNKAQTLLALYKIINMSIK